MTFEEPFEKPRWVKDILRYLPLKPQFVLSGTCAITIWSSSRREP